MLKHGKLAMMVVVVAMLAGCDQKYRVAKSGFSFKKNAKLAAIKEFFGGMDETEMAEFAALSIRV